MSEPMEESRPKVSVSLITYNHADFIAQAIESVLMQETAFDYELVIGEDDSSDVTREIVKAYKEKYPDRIRLLLNDRENVIYIDGRPTGRWNFINTLQHCTGEYIALLEGDDYWTDPLKLQKQVNLLEAHPEYAMCAHRVMQVYEEENHAPRIYPHFKPKRVYCLRDLLVQAQLPTCSIVFRNKLFEEFPEWYYKAPQGDWPLHILNAQHGDIVFIEEVMGVYRVHQGGVFSFENEKQKLEWGIQKIQTINTHLEFQFNSIAQSEIALKRARIAILEKDLFQAIQWLAKHFYYSFFTALAHPRRLFFILFKDNIPGYNHLRELRDKLRNRRPYLECISKHLNLDGE